MAAPTIANYVLTGDSYRWGADQGVKLGAATTITYSIPTANNHNLSYAGITQISQAEAAAIQEAFKYIASFTKIKFVQVEANKGDLQFLAGDLGAGLGGQAPHVTPGPGPKGGGFAWGVVMMNNLQGYRLDDKSFKPGEISPNDLGGSAWQTLIHEIAHTLGIKHPHDLNAAGNASSIMPKSMDNLTLSSMSYTGYGPSLVAVKNISTPGYSTSNLKPSTFGISDIAALQYLYGANTSSKGGHTYAFKPDQPIYMTISDRGPNNTIVVSALKGTNHINLTQGTFSDLAIHGQYQEVISKNAYDGTHALAIAYGVNIAKVIGGSGSDHVTGNSIANSLYGRGGSDFLSGGKGDDKLFGGNGADKLDGGDGVDYARYDDAKYGNLVISLLTPSKNTGAAKGDTYVSIEGVVGGLGNDTITGNAKANTLIGGGGNDKVNGGDGSDKLIGELGKDTLTGGTGADTFIFRASTDSKTGSANRDVITDFHHGEKDRIDLSGIDAISKTTGKNDAFTFLTKEGADFKHAGELHFDHQGSGASKITLVEGDINGDGHADFSIQLHGWIDFVKADFVL